MAAPSGFVAGCDRDHICSLIVVHVTTAIRLRSPTEIRRALIVEDDAALRAALAETLRRQGFEVAEVADGLTALRFIRGKPPVDLMILDLDLPVMNGWELRESMRHDEGWAK